MGGVVVAGLVVVEGGDVDGAGPPAFSVLGIGAGPGGDAGDAATPCSATRALGGGATVARGDDGAGASATAGPEAAEVGGVLVRLVALSASRMTKVTTAKPTRKAATHAPTRSARRARALRGGPLSPPSATWPVGTPGAADSSRTYASRTVAGETGTLPAFRISPPGET